MPTWGQILTEFNTPPNNPDSVRRNYLSRLAIDKKAKDKASIQEKTHPPLDLRVKNIQDFVSKNEMGVVQGKNGDSRFSEYNDLLKSDRR